MPPTKRLELAAMATLAQWGHSAGFAECVVAELSRRLEGGDLEFALGQLGSPDPTAEQVAGLAESSGVGPADAFLVDLARAWSMGACQPLANPDSGADAEPTESV